MKLTLFPLGFAVLLIGTLIDGRGEGVVVTAAPSAAATTNEADARLIAEARAAGQHGLDALMAANEDLIGRMRSGATPLSDPAAAKLRTTLDAVAKQRDAHASGLYWYTDLDAAKAEAKASGRRILSLRLLGNLDEEFSCANSRFFRTALYANKKVSDYLRENFVLHWKSVRPAPKLTIDMGDGRRLERTITGNSIHYVLAPSGCVLDAIPGLYGPRAFMRALGATEPEFHGILDTTQGPLPRDPFYTALKVDAVTDATGMALAKFHGEAADAICHRWLSSAIEGGMYGEAISRQWDKEGGRNLMPRLLPIAFPARPNAVESARRNFGSPDYTPAKSKGRAPATPQSKSSLAVSAQKPSSSQRKPSATAAEMRTFGKRMVEEPIIRRGMPELENFEEAKGDPAPGKSLPSRMTTALWKRLGALASRSRYMNLELDEASRRFMMAKLPAEAVRADERATGDVIDGNTPFARTLRNFEAAMAEDTLRNEYLFHSQIHQWLEDPVTGLALARDVEALNKRVYAELFLTPDHDAWLGLVPENVYTALEKDGCACDVMRGKK